MDTKTVRQCVPDLGGGNRKSSAADRRKSEGWYNESGYYMLIPQTTSHTSRRLISAEKAHININITTL